MKQNNKTWLNWSVNMYIRHMFIGKWTEKRILKSNETTIQSSWNFDATLFFKFFWNINICPKELIKTDLIFREIKLNENKIGILKDILNSICKRLYYIHQLYIEW